MASVSVPTLSAEATRAATAATAQARAAKTAVPQVKAAATRFPPPTVEANQLWLDINPGDEAGESPFDYPGTIATRLPLIGTQLDARRSTNNQAITEFVNAAFLAQHATVEKLLNDGGAAEWLGEIRRVVE